MSSRDVRIPLPTGETIQAVVAEPDGPSSAVVVIHPATATPQGYYRRFAQFLTEQGVAVVTYDYRGTGRSGAPKEHRGVRMRDWMSTEVPAVAAWARGEHPSLPQHAVGHSVGGHALALGWGTQHLTSFATVASHAGVTATIPRPAERRRIGAFFAVAPAMSRVLGYAPARRAGFGEDFPSAALVDWAAWTRRPGYFYDDPSMDAAARAASVRLPVLGIGASDDDWATPQQIDAILDRMSAARVERWTLTPQELGVDRLGHHGMFRKEPGRILWPRLHGWLRSHEASEGLA
mgnify:CR=1 FL=1